MGPSQPKTRGDPEAPKGGDKGRFQRTGTPVAVPGLTLHMSTLQMAARWDTSLFLGAGQGPADRERVPSNSLAPPVFEFALSLCGSKWADQYIPCRRRNLVAWPGKQSPSSETTVLAMPMVSEGCDGSSAECTL